MYCNVCNCNLCDLHPRHTSSADCLVINNKNKNRDSITEMLQTLNWPSLEKRRKRSRLILLFKLLNNMIYIPTEYLPVPSPLTNTRSNHNRKLLQLFARTNYYQNSF